MARRVVTSCKWNNLTAFYVGDVFKLSLRDVAWLPPAIFNMLGCEYARLADVPLYNHEPEFDWSEDQGWVPPKTLAKLKEQFAAYDLRIAKGDVEAAELYLRNARDKLEKLETPEIHKAKKELQEALRT